MNELKKLKKIIENIEITYDYEETYNNLYNAVIDYSNNTQNWDFEYLFEDFIDYEIAEEIAKKEIDQGGLIRVYYFLENANLNNDLFKINGYGNLQDVDRSDLEELKEEIIYIINNKLTI